MKKLIAFFLLTSALCFAQINNGGGGGTPAFSGITSGTNTSAAMVVGSGASILPATGGKIRATGPGPNVVSAQDFGIVSDHRVLDGNITSGQSIVTSATAHFNSFCTVGNFVQGANAVVGVIIPRGTISSCDSDTQIHVSTTALFTSSTVDLMWGPDNTTALSNAYAATVTAGGFLYIPQGNYFTTTAQFITTGTLGVFGDDGWANTVIVPTFDFNFATCTGGVSSNSCFFGVHFGTYDFLTIDGMNGGSTSAAANLVENRGGYFYRIRGNGWCSTCANTDGKLFSATSPIDTEGSAVNFGPINCVSNANGAISILNPCFAQGVGGSGTAANSLYGLQVNSGYFASYSNFYTGSTFAINVLSPGVLTEVDDSTNIPGGSKLQNAGVHNLYHFVGAAGSTVSNLSGGTIRINNSDFSAVTSGAWITNASGGTVLDECGNVYPAAHPASNSGTYKGDGCPSVIVTSAKLVLSGTWGSTAAWSALTGFNNFVGTITASGTGQGANPTITYTFPAPFPVTPQNCVATIVKSNDAGVTITNNFLAASSLSATSVTFTYAGTPVASDTYTVQGQCFN